MEPNDMNYEQDERDPVYWRTNQSDLTVECLEHDRNCHCPDCEGEPDVSREANITASVDPMDHDQARETISRYCCSNCWGHLVAYIQHDGSVYVLCPACGEETRGYVSKRYAERRRQESAGEAIEVRHNLRNIIQTPVSTKSESQLLSELGY